MSENPDENHYAANENHQQQYSRIRVVRLHADRIISRGWVGTDCSYRACARIALEPRFNQIQNGRNRHASPCDERHRRIQKQRNQRAS
jgi:hypothetical protein